MDSDEDECEMVIIWNFLDATRRDVTLGKNTFTHM